MFTSLLAALLSFVLGYTGLHYFLSSLGTRKEIAVAAGIIFGILLAFFATIAVEAWVVL